jgi:hypothetical protein
MPSPGSARRLKARLRRPGGNAHASPSGAGGTSASSDISPAARGGERVRRRPGREQRVGIGQCARLPAPDVLGDLAQQGLLVEHQLARRQRLPGLERVFGERALAEAMDREDRRQVHLLDRRRRRRRRVGSGVCASASRSNVRRERQRRPLAASGASASSETSPSS